MRSIIDRAFDIFREKKPNIYWENGRLVGQDGLEKQVLEVVHAPLFIENNIDIFGVHVFGDILDFKDKDFYKKKPSDLDIYFWASENPPVTEFEELIGGVMKIPNDLPLHIILRIYHPFQTDYHSEMNIFDIHKLYQDSRINDETLGAILKKDLLGLDVLEYLNPEKS